MSKSLMLTGALVLVTAPSIAFAQNIPLPVRKLSLTVRNTAEKTVAMQYGPLKDRGTVSMKQITLPANKSMNIKISKNDPWDVHCWQKGDATFQAHVSVTTGVRLWQLAKNHEHDPDFSFDLETTLAAKEKNGKQISQVMSARFVNSKNGNYHQLFEAASETSRFAEKILKEKWKTTFRAGSGQNVRADVRLGKYKFQTSQFVGRFHHLAIFEDDLKCVFFARWTGPNNKRQLGDVYFTVTKKNPSRLTGFYTFDDRQGKTFPWNSR